MLTISDNNKIFSIIIPTKNSERRINKTLEAILNLHRNDLTVLEIIVVNNNSTDRTIDDILAFKAKLDNSISFKLINESKPGKSEAIKTGFQNSAGDYIIICDDDNILDPYYLLNAQDLLNEFRDVGILGGKSTAVLEAKAPSWFEKWKLNYAVGSQAKEEYKSSKVYHVWGAGMVIRRSILSIVYSNSVQFLTGKKTFEHYISGEDYELCYFARKLGWEIMYSPQLVFKHLIIKERLNWNYFQEVSTRNFIPLVYLSVYDYLDTQSLNSIETKSLDIFLLKFKRQIRKDLYLKYFPKQVLCGLIGYNEGYGFNVAYYSYNEMLKELDSLKGELELLLIKAKSNLELLREKCNKARDG